jgi:hypothetical protein
MNDDFLYTRQEVPEPEFVAHVQSLLDGIEQAEKPKRKTGQKRFAWKGIVAAAASLVAAITIFWTTPEIHVPVMSMVYGYPNESVLRRFQEFVGFDYPEIPNGYYIASIRSTQLDPESLVMYWRTYRKTCTISLMVYENPEVSGITVQEVEYNHYLAETYAGIDIESLGGGIEATWRLTTLYNRPNQMSLDWQIGDMIYNLETQEMCLSRAEFSAIAESIVPDSP